MNIIKITASRPCEESTSEQRLAEAKSVLAGQGFNRFTTAIERREQV